MANKIINEFNNMDTQIRTIHTQLSNARNINSTILISLKECGKEINMNTMRNYFVFLLSSKSILLPDEWRNKAISYMNKLGEREIPIEKAIEFFTNSEKQLRTSLKLFNENYF